MKHNYTVGIFLKGHRLKLKIKQKTLALLLKYPNGQLISNWERGICNPPLKSVRMLAALLGIKEVQLKEVLIRDFTCRVERAFK